MSAQVMGSTARRRTALQALNRTHTPQCTRPVARKGKRVHLVEGAHALNDALRLVVRVWVVHLSGNEC